MQSHCMFFLPFLQEDFTLLFNTAPLPGPVPRRTQKHRVLFCGRVCGKVIAVQCVGVSVVELENDKILDNAPTDDPN